MRHEKRSVSLKDGHEGVHYRCPETGDGPIHERFSGFPGGMVCPACRPHRVHRRLGVGIRHQRDDTMRYGQQHWRFERQPGEEAPAALCRRAVRIDPIATWRAD
jgi:hypothetical protein